MLIAVGALLILAGGSSRLVSLGLYRRIAASPSRAVTPSVLPGVPWLRVISDSQALKVIVYTTYASVLLGMAFVLVGIFI